MIVLPEAQVENQTGRINHRRGALRAGVTALALSVAALGAGCSADNEAVSPVDASTSLTAGTTMQPGTTETTVDAAKIEQEKAEMEDAWGVIQAEAIQSAASVTYLMDTQDLGIVNHTDRMIGNKGAIIGPDGVMRTTDDEFYKDIPEMRIELNPVSRTIAFSATKLDGSLEDPTFNSIYSTFSVATDNPILSKDGALTSEDFRVALMEPGTGLITIRVGQNWGYSNEDGQVRGQTVEVAQRDGKYYANSELSGYGDVYESRLVEDAARLASRGDALVASLDYVTELYAVAATRGDVK